MATRKKKAQEEPSAEQIERLRNTVALQNRIHYGRTTGKVVTQLGGSIICGILDPINGLGQLFGFGEQLFSGAREGVLTSRLIYIDARAKTSRKTVQHLEEKLKKAKAHENGNAEFFMSDEEIEELEPQLDFSSGAT